MVASTAPSLTINRTLRAPVAAVYAAWTDPVKMAQWFAPADGFACEVPECDVRVGGRFRIVMLGPDGERHCVSGAYREVIENERLVFSWFWETTPERVSQVTVTLGYHEGATRLQLRHEQFADEQARDRHSMGWTACLDRLAAKISQLK